MYNPSLAFASNFLHLLQTFGWQVQSPNAVLKLVLRFWGILQNHQKRKPLLSEHAQLLILIIFRQLSMLSSGSQLTAHTLFLQKLQ